MTDLKALSQKIDQLDQRLKKLEDFINTTSSTPSDFTFDLLSQARDLVIKHQKASPIFLQRKLLIDFQRAKLLLSQLEQEGIVGPSLGFGPRQVLKTSR